MKMDKFTKTALAMLVLCAGNLIIGLIDSWAEDWPRHDFLFLGIVLFTVGLWGYVLRSHLHFNRKIQRLDELNTRMMQALGDDNDRLFKQYAKAANDLAMSLPEPLRHEIQIQTEPPDDLPPTA